MRQYGRTPLAAVAPGRTISLSRECLNSSARRPTKAWQPVFLGGPATATALDLGAVNVRTLASVQRSERLDHDPPFRGRATRLRWSAETSDGEQEIEFTLGADGLRTVRLRTPELNPRALAEFCADLALHDWLLSTLLDIVDRAVGRSRPAPELISMLRPGIDNLVHAWMPAAHVSRTLDRIWQELDLRAGFSLQWQKTVERIRDQLSVGSGRGPEQPLYRATEVGVRMTSGRTDRSLGAGNRAESRAPDARRRLITLVGAHFGGMQAGDALELAAVVAFAFALALFIVDTQIRISAVGERATAGFTQIGKAG